MPIKEFKFPDVGEGISEGEIIRWLVSVGQSVKEDDPLVEVETDKAVATLPSPFSGKIISLHGKAGEIIKVGDVLVRLEEGDGPAPKERAPDAGSVVGRIEEGAKREALATPVVRNLAREWKIDLAQVVGTGPAGRITRLDLERYRAEKEKPAVTPPSHRRATDRNEPTERIPLRGIRRSGARHLSEAARKIAPVTFMDEADVNDLDLVRSKEKQVAESQGIRLTYVPFVMKAVIAGLKRHPYLNASLDEEQNEIVLKKYYDLGIAVDTKEGLMVFVVRGADQKSILELARDISNLTERSEKRTIGLEELKGSTFTITNYGVIGGLFGTPIVNFPEAAILGMGRIEERPVVREGKIVARKILPLSLTFDHRLVDGAEAARFMNVVIEHLEDPNLMLIEGK